MFRVVISVLVTLIASPAALSQPLESVAVRANEAVSVRIDPTGGLSIDGRDMNPTLSALDREVARRSVGGEFADVVGDRFFAVTADDTSYPAAEIVPPGVIRFSFFRFSAGSGHAFLVIENGYDRGLVYRAQIRRGDRVVPTDVCLVMPMKRGIEYWPYPVDEISFSSIRLIPWQESDGMPCE